MAGRLVWLASCCLLLFAGMALAGEEQSKRHAEGRALYNYRCYFCHGYSGNAKTLAATYLTPPPVDFTRADPARLTREFVVGVLESGRPGTAMKSFHGILKHEEMASVAEFVVTEFVERKGVNTRYHTPENGWRDHLRYRKAFPFAKGEIPLSRPWESLSADEAEGKRLYLSACISCHDRGAMDPESVAWDARPLSYPRNNYVPGGGAPIDAMTSATPYAQHDVPKRIAGLTSEEQRGARLFVGNCAFCHGADGTGKNWIGSFLEPHPRNLTDDAAMAGMTRSRLAQTIREGLPGTSMPAWKSVLNESEIAAIVAYVNRAFHTLAKE